MSILLVALVVIFVLGVITKGFFYTVGVFVTFALLLAGVFAYMEYKDDIKRGEEDGSNS